jgi:hypothetical protein
MDGDIVVPSSWTDGTPVLDFDYAQMHAPAWVFAPPYNQESPPRGNLHGWNLWHELSIVRTSTTWKNSDVAIKYDTSKLTFNSNPSTDVIKINGKNITYGTTISAGATASDSIDNLTTWLAANQPYTRYYKDGSNVLWLYGASPRSTKIMSGSAISQQKWNMGAVGVRQTNAWNCRFKFRKLFNFDVGLWHEPWNNLGGVTPGVESQFGSENNTVDFGKVQDCQIAQLFYSGDHGIAEDMEGGYINDTRIVDGSIRFIQGSTLNAYVTVIDATETIGLFFDYIDAEGTTSTPTVNELCGILVNGGKTYNIIYKARNEAFNILCRAEVGNPLDANYISGGPYNIWIEQTETYARYDLVAGEGNLIVDDNTPKKRIYTTMSADRRIVSPSFSNPFTTTICENNNLFRGARTNGSTTVVDGFSWFVNGEGYVRHDYGSSASYSLNGLVYLDNTQGIGQELTSLTGDEQFVLVTSSGSGRPNESEVRINVRLFDNTNTEITAADSVLISSNFDAPTYYDATNKCFIAVGGSMLTRSITFKNSNIRKAFIWVCSNVGYQIPIESFGLYQHWSSQPAQIEPNTFTGGSKGVASLTAAATAGKGARSFVNDATATTFASVVAGGGANAVPVYSDGTNWRIG